MAGKKLTYQMISPGEAWNNFVNSKEGHNAAAVTPSYLDFNKVPEKKNKPNVYYVAINNKDEKPYEQQKQAVKELEVER